MNYLAKCTPNCGSFKGDTSPIWVKIEQMGFNKTANPQWGSDKLARLGAKWPITIPKSLAPGEYLLRHEILGLHVAGKRMGAQFYPSVINRPGILLIGQNLRPDQGRRIRDCAAAPGRRAAWHVQSG
jgi:hypothetical protein